MIVIGRTNSANPDFINLVSRLDDFLKTVDGDENAFYHQYNGIENLNHVVLAYSGTTVVGCGAFKKFDSGTVEIKRMFVLEESRGKGVATIILNELEKWAFELHFSSCILETSKRQTEAIQLYKKNDYIIIPNYEPYTGVTNSLCFQKVISG